MSLNEAGMLRRVVGQGVWAAMPHAEEWLYWGNSCGYTLRLESSWKKYCGVWTSFNVYEKYLLKAHIAPEH